MAIPFKKNKVEPQPQAKPLQKISAPAPAKHNNPTEERGISYETPQQFPLTKKNFIFMAIAGAMIVIGFLLMLGGGTTTESFNADIFSTRRTVIGPTVAFLGFVAMGIAIVIKPKGASEEGGSPSK